MAAKDLNRHTCTGRLTADPTTRSMPSGDTICEVRIAMNDSYKDKNSGQIVEKAEYVSYVATGKLADICATYLRKGSKIYTEGRLTTRKWKDNSGNDRYTTEIRMENMQMLDTRQQEGHSSHGGGGNPGGASYGPSNRTRNAPAQSQPPSHFDEDIPF